MNHHEIVNRLRSIVALHEDCEHISNDIDAHPCGVIDSINWLAARIESESLVASPKEGLRDVE